MNPQRWQKVEEVFQTAIELQPAEREAFLTQVCGDDDDLFTEVQSLLAHEIEEGYFESAIEGGAKAFAQATVENIIGHRVGAYRVTGLVGQGGMGAVYSAVRDDDQYQQQVAIKIVKRGMDTSAVLHRFWRERQILASLSHQNIARLLDGGTTSDGLPYFVMEFIEGQPITEYCENNQLTVLDRLKLFRQVCAAVQFAHQNLVVHRDIKPTNILVTKDGVPKLLDFGIAKLISSETSQAVTRTVTGLRMMTPEYASPEQFRGLPITTATDIYSLGTVLYELLTGSRAHRFKTYSPLEIEQTVCITEAEKPSEAAAHSTGAPFRWRRQLTGDLDNIVMMALRKEAERRYRSVEQFSEDIRRHLEGLPVTARKDTLAYRAGKFSRRHKLGLAATAFVILTLVGGIIVSVYQTRRAERRFQQVRKLANTFLFDFHDKIRYLPGSTEAREMVVKTAIEYLDSLTAESGGDPALEWELASAYQKVGDVQGSPWEPSLGHTDEALKSYGKALVLAEKLAANNKDDLNIQRLLAKSSYSIGTLRAENGDKDNSYDLLRRSITISEEIARQSQERVDASFLSDCYVRLGDVYLDTGDARSGLEFYRRSLELSIHWQKRLKDGLAPKDVKEDNIIFGVASDYAHVGEALISVGDLDGAMEQYRQSLLLFKEIADRNPTNDYYKRNLRVDYTWLGSLSGNPKFVNAGNAATAESYYRSGLAISEKIAARDPKSASAKLDLITCYNLLGDVFSDRDPVQSIAHYSKAMAVVLTLLADSPNDYRFLRRKLTTLTSIAAPMRKMGDSANAMKHLREAIQIARQLTSRFPTNPQVQSSLQTVLLETAHALIESGDYDSALEHLKESVQLAEKSAAAARSDVYTRWRLANSYDGMGRFHDAMVADAKSSFNQRQFHRNESCLWKRKAMEIWDRWSDYGVSSIFNTTKRDQAAHALTQCEAASKLSQSRP